MRTPHLDDVDEELEELLRRTVALRTLTNRGIEVAGSIAALARRLEVAPSHVGHMRSGRVGMGVECCLLLAEVLDEDPFLILHKCGYATLSARLEKLRQPDTKAPRAELHERLDRLPGRDREIVAGLIDRLLVDAKSDMPAADPPRRRGSR